jgi:hypothetical protein
VQAWTAPVSPLAKVYPTLKYDYAVLVDESNFVEMVLDEEKDVILVVAVSGCMFCAEVETHIEQLQKKRLRKAGIKTVRVAIMDYNATSPDHPVMKHIEYGLHYPAIFLYTEIGKENPISLSQFVGDLGPQMLVNDLTGMLLWHKMWSEEEIERLKRAISPKLWEKIQKDAAFTNAGVASRAEKDGGDVSSLLKPELSMNAEYNEDPEGQPEYHDPHEEL